MLSDMRSVFVLRSKNHVLSLCSFLNCFQGLYLQSQLFQVSYIQSPLAFQTIFSSNRFPRRIKPSREQRQPT